TFIMTFYSFIFFFNHSATSEIYTLSLHDALPIWLPWLRLTAKNKGCSTLRIRRTRSTPRWLNLISARLNQAWPAHVVRRTALPRSEEHTSELQSLAYLVCRLLLEKKNKKQKQ